MRRHQYARNTLYSLTDELLEMVESESELEQQVPYLRYRVGVIYQSVWDFLRGECQTPFESRAQEVEVFSRLRSAKVKFMPPMGLDEALVKPLRWVIHHMFECTFIWLCEQLMEGLYALMKCMDNFEQTMHVRMEDTATVDNSSNLGVDGSESVAPLTGVYGVLLATRTPQCIWRGIWVSSFRGCHTLNAP